ncbi:endolytic transglycosylase MltG [Salirhabdus sp. Marseille-P4669]|uniref:endolytic transglycosylase MltG n=1 Tax=Salirhabdus sp. Marseille-P4669 TaxID=2042310 RepID=UPI001F187D31|nr:endolytic transglycosylase MltG [Salirhabdus sp. Marseille-P4669]
MSTSNQDEERYKEAKTVRKIVLIVFAVIMVFIIAIGVSGYLYVKSALEPMDPKDDTIKSVEIPLGSSISTIGEILEEHSIIKSGTIFRYYTKFKNETEFQAGNYDFSASMTLDEIIDTLKTGKLMEEAVLTVTIPEGKKLEDIAKIFAQHTSITEEEFMKTVNDPEFIENVMNMYPTILSEEILNSDIIHPLEGYLFAATYDFNTETPTVESIIIAMLDKTEEVVLKYMNQIEEFEDEDLTIHEALTMASLVENEAREVNDRKLIADVFYNRLDEGMPLQTDPTVLYALGEHKDRVLTEYTEIDSPYNTYMYTGLPVGPISNFAENALEAVLNPEPTSALYFLAATDTGKVYYSDTLEEHNQKKAQYIHN